MKTEILTKSVKVQETKSNIFATLPKWVRDILDIKKGDVIEYVIYTDKTVELRKVGE